MVNMENKLKCFFKEIKEANDLDIISMTCNELYRYVNSTKLKDFYFGKIRKFNDYFITDDYIKDFNCFIENTINKIYEKYLLDKENEIVINSQIPIYNNILNSNFKDMNISEGLIYAYSSLALSEELNSFKHIDFLYNIKSKLFCDIDYFLFDIIFNPTRTKCDYLKYTTEQDEALILTYLNKDEGNINLIKIITTKMIKDFILFVEHSNQKSNATVQHPLNETEL